MYRASSSAFCLIDTGNGKWISPSKFVSCLFFLRNALAHVSMFPDYYEDFSEIILFQSAVNHHVQPHVIMYAYILFRSRYVHMPVYTIFTRRCTNTAALIAIQNICSYMRTGYIIRKNRLNRVYKNPADFGGLSLMWFEDFSTTRIKEPRMEMPRLVVILLSILQA